MRGHKGGVHKFARKAKPGGSGDRVGHEMRGKRR